MEPRRPRTAATLHAPGKWRVPVFPAAQPDRIAAASSDTMLMYRLLIQLLPAEAQVHEHALECLHQDLPLARGEAFECRDLRFRDETPDDWRNRRRLLRDRKGACPAIARTRAPLASLRVSMLSPQHVTPMTSA
jgi:hypothetical protein